MIKSASYRAPFARHCRAPQGYLKTAVGECVEVRARQCHQGFVELEDAGGLSATGRRRHGESSRL
ncbi:hypothetical protein B5P43_18600 [Bacillus sp. SRB_336]|nr:hypothetical protein B5P43_18600 [Bacillus sp. SRB_336]